MGVGLDQAQSRPLVSVIIPHFSRPALLARALRSVDAQTYRPLEVIVVDDASPLDPEPGIVALGLQLDIRVIRLEKNAGPSAARNAGLQAAAGDYVAFLDSDDEWLPAKLEIQVGAAEAAGQRDNVFCISQTFIQRSKGQEVRRLWKPAEERLGEYFFLNRGIMQTSSFLVSRALARSIGFDPLLRQFEDILFVIRAAEEGGHFVFQTDCLFHWYRDDREDQLSRSISLESGFRFLERAKGSLNSRERLAFTTRFLGPALARYRPGFFAGQAFSALRCGVLTPRALAGVIYRSRRTARA